MELGREAVEGLGWDLTISWTGSGFSALIFVCCFGGEGTLSGGGGGGDGELAV